MKKIIFLMILTMLSGITVRGISFEDSSEHTSDDLFQYVLEMERAYSDIIEVEVLGYSFDQKPIYVVRLSEDLSNERLNTEKMHALIESGTHSREVANPIINIKILENYINDYYDDSINNDINVSSILKESVFHFIINSNPDGFDLTKFGVSSIQTEYAKDILLSLEDQEYANYKANLRGIDLNRNYPATYYDPKSAEWINIWEVEDIDDYHTEYPSGAFHGGTAGSEIETQILMDYVTRYDFRFVNSLHSKGEVIFWSRWFTPESLKERSYNLSKIISDESGYRLMASESMTVGIGFLSEYVVSSIMKPFFTIETLDYKLELPNVASQYIVDAFYKNVNIPYLMMEECLSGGYYRYKLYIDDVYVRDFEEKVYAIAYAKRLGGVILDYEGDPRYYIDRVSKGEYISQEFDALMENIKLEEIKKSQYVSYGVFINILQHKIEGLKVVGNLTGYISINDCTEIYNKLVNLDESLEAYIYLY